MTFKKDPRTRAEIAAARKRTKARYAAIRKSLTTKQKAEVRSAALKFARQKDYPFKKEAFKQYKELGGTLTLKQVNAKKTTTAKRKGC